MFMFGNIKIPESKMRGDLKDLAEFQNKFGVRAYSL